MEEAEIRPLGSRWVGFWLPKLLAGAIWLLGVQSMRVWGMRGVVSTLTVSEGRAGGGLGGHQAGCWWGQEQGLSAREVWPAVPRALSNSARRLCLDSLCLIPPLLPPAPPLCPSLT